MNKFAPVLSFLVAIAPSAHGQVVGSPPAPALGSKAHAAQNELNRELYLKLVEGPDGSPGEWLSEDLQESVSVSMSPEGAVTFRRSRRAANGEWVAQAPVEHRIDEAAATVVHLENGQAVRWTRVTRDGYRYETHDGSYAFAGKLLGIVRPGGKIEQYLWSPPQQPVARLASQEAIASTPPHLLARWGDGAGMMGKAYVNYNPLTLLLVTDTVAHYDWLVPGVSARTSSVGPDGKRRLGGELRWNEQAGRIDVYNEFGHLIGHASVESDGSLRYVYPNTETRVRALPDGRVETSWSGPSIGAGRSVLFPNTDEGLRLAWQALALDRRAEEDARTAEHRARRAEANAKTERFMAAIGGMQQALTTAEEAYDASRAAMDAPIAESPANTMAAPRPAATPTAPASEPPPGHALRFVLSIGLQVRSGDRVNPTCYSNVITRPGPPGWGQRGFLPPGSAQSAHDTVQSYKADFIASCQSASGRSVTSEGDFHWTWNETQDGDRQISNTRSQYPEDVTVSL